MRRTVCTHERHGRHRPRAHGCRAWSPVRLCRWVLVSASFLFFLDIPFKAPGSCSAPSDPLSFLACKHFLQSVIHGTTCSSLCHSTGTEASLNQQEDAAEAIRQMVHGLSTHATVWNMSDPSAARDAMTFTSSCAWGIREVLEIPDLSVRYARQCRDSCSASRMRSFSRPCSTPDSTSILVCWALTRFVTVAGWH